VADDISKGRKGKGRKRVKQVYNITACPTGAHSLAQGTVAGQARGTAKAAGNPAEQVHSGTGSYDRDRLSRPLTEGRASVSPGATYSTFDRPDGAGLAAGHPDLREGSTAVSPWQSLRLANQDRPDAEIVWGTGRVAVQRLSTGDGPDFTSRPSGNPAMRPLPHTARGSATAAGGGQGAGSGLSRPPAATSPYGRPPVAAKAQTPLEIMRDQQRVIDGR